MRQPIPVGQEPGGRAVGRGSANFNYGTAFGLTPIEAAQATSMSNQPGGAGDLIKQRNAGLARVQQAFPGSQFVENPMYGGLMTPTSTRAPRQSFSQLGAPTSDLDDPRNLFPQGSQPGAMTTRTVTPSAPISTAPPPPSTLEKVSEGFRRMMRPVAGAVATGARYALPPVAGLSAGLDIAEAAHEYGKPERDYTTIGLRGASALGGGLSMIPATAAVGVPLSLGASAIQAYREDPEIFKKLRRRIFSSDNPEQMVAP
jgi:hypothetical protein